MPKNGTFQSFLRFAAIADVIIKFSRFCKVVSCGRYLYMSKPECFKRFRN